jgi:hypothetical protein
MNDLRAMLATVNIVGAGALVWAMAPDVANGATTLLADDGGSLFPGMSPLGGTMLGLDAFVTEGLSQGVLVLLDAGGIAADVGDVRLDAARDASIEMRTDPANNSLTPAVSANLISMFQTNSVALRAVLSFGCEKFRTSATSVLEGVGWGNVVSG